MEYEATSRVVKDAESLFDKALSMVSNEAVDYATFSLLAAKRAREIMKENNIAIEDIASRMNLGVGEARRLLSGMQNRINRKG